MRRLNVKLVVLLSTISVVAVVLVAVVHGWQMKRTARVLLVRAKEAQSQAEESDDDKDLETAASLYQQYVAYRPEDAEEGAQMALLMADLAEKPGASKHKRFAAYSRLKSNSDGTQSATTCGRASSTPRCPWADGATPSITSRSC